MTEFSEIHIRDAAYPRIYAAWLESTLTFAQWGTPAEGPPFPSMVVSKHKPSAKKTPICGIFKGLIQALQSIIMSFPSRACQFPPSQAVRLYCHVSLKTPSRPVSASVPG